METIPVKEKIKKQLIESAKKYNSLLNKRIVIFSNDFELRNEYTIRFYETNFLHLTGVQTMLSPKDFYQKCLNATIEQDDFESELNKSQKILVQRKMRNLINIDLFFYQEIEVQESFSKGKVICLLATSDNKCTIGFADAKYCLRPKTVLDKNHLDKNKPIIKVIPHVYAI